MTVELPRRLTVAACIGCGARSRPGECPDGCSDVPLDIVDAGPVDALAEHVKALRARVRALGSGAAEYDRFVHAADELVREESDLTRIVRTVANVRPRPGHEEATAAALRRMLAKR